MPDLYPAQLDGFDLDIESINDEIESAIVRHEYPYRNGALLEDMGQKARSVRIRCYFWDNGDHQTYDTHTELLAYLEGMEIGELIHPQYGPMRGCVESIHVQHDDRERTAEVDITFVQGLIEDADDTTSEELVSAAEGTYADGIGQQMDEFSNDVSEALGAEANTILGLDLDPLLGIVEQFEGVSTTARKYLQTVESYVGTMEGALNVIANPANGLVSALNYGLNLPGRVIGSVARCLERYSILADGLRVAPSRFADNLSLALDELTNVSGDFGKTTQIGGASHIAMQTAYCYQTDTDLRSERLRVEGKPVFDTLGRYSPPEISDSTADVMTVQELEASLATVRGLLQDAVSLSRSVPALKQQALQLQAHVGVIKLEREKTMRVRLDNPMPLHLVCLRYGLPYSAAPRLLAINDAVHNPNVVAGEIDVFSSVSGVSA